jgi:peptidoglycan lytic transglycosylase
MRSLILSLLCCMFLSLSCEARTHKLNLGYPPTSGYASWYGRREQGKRMANGKRFDRNAYTCASRYYPMGTLLSVYYPRTSRTVAVIVTDHGPWVRSRVLDLSERSAKDLGLRSYGVDRVIITPTHFKFKENPWYSEQHKKEF